MIVATAIRSPKYLRIGLVIGLLALAGTAEAATAAGRDDGDYQLMKATPDRVWRLNKRTGEVAICAQQGRRVVCTASTETESPPALSDGERKVRDEQRRARSLAFFDRIIALFREFIRAVMDQEGGR